MWKNSVSEVDFSEFKKLVAKLPEMLKEKEKREEWSLKIVRIDNGYKLTGNGEIIKEMVIEDSDTDELKGHEQLLWQIMEYFNFGGSKHDPERLRIVRQKNK